MIWANLKRQKKKKKRKKINKNRSLFLMNYMDFESLTPGFKHFQ